MTLKNDWIYGKEGNHEIRTCKKCKTSQIKNIEGDWVVLVTGERIDEYFKNLMLGIKEDCPHQQWIED